MENRWNANKSLPSDQLELLVLVSHMLGADTRLVLAGGGNTSVKRIEKDYLGRDTKVLRVKASGYRLSTIKAEGFGGVRLKELNELRQRDAMSDEDMVHYIAHTLLSPDQPRPSIETLLHAWIPYSWVLHTHANAVLSTLNNRFGTDALREIYGNLLPVIRYQRPGFALSKQVAEAVEADSNAEGVLLLNHGLVTWGDDAETAYNRHIQYVSLAEQFIAKHSSKTVSIPAQMTAFGEINEDERTRRISALAPILRGFLKKDASDPLLLAYDGSPETLNFTIREDLTVLAQSVPATPEHLLSLKPSAMVLPISSWEEPGAVKVLVRDTVARYQKSYEQYIAGNGGSAASSHHSSPRVVIVPGLGVWTSGESRQEAEFSREAFQHTISIMADAQKIGSYRPLPEEDMYSAEYWPMELYKLSKRLRKGELYGRVALITGGAKGIGLAVARLFLQEGACVCIADIDQGAMELAQADLGGEFAGRIQTVRMDVTNEQSVDEAVQSVCVHFGGLDILVSNAGIAPFGSVLTTSLKDWERSFDINATGHFLVSRSVVRVLLAQGFGGSLVFVNTKNVPAPGKDFGAYSCAKAAEAQLCRILAIEHGSDKIRSNMINPDSIITDLWTPAMKENRAKAYGIEPDAFEEFLRSRSLMKETVKVEDVAQAALFLASERSRITTGCIVSVDAGSREAFPR